MAIINELEKTLREGNAMSAAVRAANLAAAGTGQAPARLPARGREARLTR
jgi:hypothetical protein